MDTNLFKEIQEMKEKLKNRKSSADSEDLEKYFRELKTELYIKRDESKILHTNLDAANLELQNLRKALDNAKKSSDEHQFNLNLVLKKSRNNEEELQEKRESLMKIQLQHKMATGEVETLKEKLQEAEMEKIELSRKVDRLESIQKHNSLYHNEISERHKNLRKFLEETNSMVVKLQAEHVQATELSKKAKLANEALEKLRLLTTENEKLKKEKEQFEEMFLKANAKYEKLEELMNKDVNIHKSNLLTKIIFNQWKQSRSHYEYQIKLTDETLNKMSESLNLEKSTNIKLIYGNEQITDQNKKLQAENTKLRDICKKHEETCRNHEETIAELNEEIKSLKKTLPELGASGGNKYNCAVKEEPIEID